MLEELFDKTTSLLDRNFLLAYWFPVITVFGFATLARVWILGWPQTLTWLQHDFMINSSDGGSSPLIGALVGFFITTIVFAYILQAFTRPIIRFFEGYWPVGIRNIIRDFPFGEKNRWRRLRSEKDEAHSKKDWQHFGPIQMELYYNFPSKENLLLPTRLGNTIRAAEDYSTEIYGMSSVFWWPRLWPLLPKKVKDEINESLIPLLTLLNLATLLSLFSISCSVYLAWIGLNFQAFIILVAGIGAGLLCYRGAVAQSRSYGEKIRSAIDLYRFRLLKAMHQQLPKNLEEEIGGWNNLFKWLYYSDRGSVTGMNYNYKKEKEDKEITKPS
jgi:hypothetical protein